MGTAPGKPGVTRWLPQIQISDLVGLLEHLAESSEPTYDIYQLTEDFGADSDLVLRLIDTAELLGFVRVGQGDVMLTPLGETFSEASILTRKEIFSTRIRRLPIFQWLINMLQIAENQSLKRDVVRLALELELPPAEAEKQLNTIIEWGRYGELIAYDDETEMLMLEPLAG
jgi:NitT/TauT family transport system ATP-binding protein